MFDSMKSGLVGGQDLLWNPSI